MNDASERYGMDGVLADFERGVLELAGMEPTPLNGKRNASYRRIEGE